MNNIQPTSKLALMLALLQGSDLTLTDGKNSMTYKGLLSVEVESGCRKSYNVKGYLVGSKQVITTHVRTID